MSFNSIIKFFTPKDRVFFSLFEEVAVTVELMGKLMKDVVAEPDFERRAVIIKRVEDLEHKNDETTHRIFTELGLNFITPFDREDIHYLAIALDDICDYIYSSSKKINFYQVNPTGDLGIQKMADIITLGSEQVRIAVFELRNMRKVKLINEAIIKINDYENQADDLFDMSVERIFETENDIKQLIKKREIYQAMETVTDKFEDAANVIESIIIKYA